MALKSTPATVLNNGFTTDFKNSSLSLVKLFQKLLSSNLCNSCFASKITTEFEGSVAICFFSCPISFSIIADLLCTIASSTLSSRTPNNLTGKGICGFSSLPLGLSLKYSKLSQQSSIRNLSFSVHQGLSLSFSNNLVPRPIICQNFV